MLAQSMVEYGALATLKVRAAQVTSTITNWIADAGPGTWAMLGVLVLGLLWLRSRRR
jgi:MYXO-CTERM domain-containing protein